MEAISYVNIFETKGLEYLLVISFLVGLLLLARCVASQAEAAVESDATGKLSAEGMDFPVTCAADFECPYKGSLVDLVEDGDELDEGRSVAS